MPLRALLTPRLLAAHLVAAAGVVAAALLGAWQYDAWQAHRAVEATDLTTAEPVPLESVLGPDDPFPGDRVGQPVTLAGSWLPEGTVLVSDREQGGRSGYWVVTPVATSEEAAIPVVCGWTADPDARSSAPAGAADVVGWLQPSEGTGAADADPADDVLPQLRSADLVQRVDADLYGGYVVARDPTPGLAPADLPQLPEAGPLTALRNLLYAIEWWFFGAFAAFVWWRYLRDVLAEDRAPQPTRDPVASRA